MTLLDTCVNLFDGLREDNWSLMSDSVFIAIGHVDAKNHAAYKKAK